MVAAYLTGALAADELAELDHHLDGCAQCRWLIDAVADHDASREVASPSDVGGTLPVGTRVGRYRVRHPIGAGGMGVVYAATDPELDRWVALKAVRTLEPGSSTRERVVFEAQAMARVSHPNVTSVYEIVECGEEIYVAMELVDGATMTAWLASPRTVREVASAFAAAGDGLAAVHAAGLFHGDVKPGNMLVGNDGRVRISDFGLAGSVRVAPVSALRGTPAYMAPELLRGAPISPASDQFALCRSLQQALVGASGRVPRRMRAAIARGLAVDPNDRHPSIEALLAELRGAMGRGRLGLVALGGGLALAALGGVALYRDGRARAELAECVAGESVWDDEARTRVERALRVPDVSYAEATWLGVDRTMTAWHDAYRRERAAACNATLVDGSQGRVELAARLGCLGDHVRRVRAFVDALELGDRETASRALVAVATLPQPEACHDPTRRPLVAAPDDPHVATEVDAVRDELARIEALEAIGSFGAAAAAAPSVVEHAEATQFAPVIAESLYRLGRTQLGTSAAGETLARAAAMADRVGDDGLRARAWITALRADYEMGRADRLESLRDNAESALARAGGTPLEWSQLHHAAGVLHVFRDELDDGERELEHALALRLDAGLTGRILAVDTLASLSIAHAKRGNLAQALEDSRRVLAILGAEFGADHPRIAGIYLSIGQMLHADLQFQRALPMLEQALRSAGEDSVLRAVVLSSLGFVRVELGDAAAAIPMHAEALAIWRGIRPDHPRLVLDLLGLGQAQLALGDTAAAVTALEQAHRISSRSTDTRGEVAFALARALAATGRPAAEVDALEREADEQFAAPGAGLSPRARRERARLVSWRAQAGR